VQQAKMSLLAVILLSGLTSASFAAETLLFQSDEPLELVLEIPSRNSLSTARDNATVPGTLQYTRNDGSDVVLDVAVSTRGNSRLELCSWPPLEINLKRKQVKSTIFATQNKLKIVTLCRRSALYRRYLNREYTIYKLYNLLTEYSFRVRMLEVTYRDSNGKQIGEVKPAFFIESDRQVAERQEMIKVEAEVINISQLDANELSILTLFQFMIGNTDWSVRKGPGTARCCHNGKIIAPPDSSNGWVVLPYDFDQSGIINAKYAVPSDSLRIRSVRQRLYRGFCSSNSYLDATIALFNDNRTAIENFFGGEHDGSRSNKSALNYLRDFYEIINDPKKRQKKIVDACQRTKS
jgi:hypothetical protein